MMENSSFISHAYIFPFLIRGGRFCNSRNYEAFMQNLLLLTSFYLPINCTREYDLLSAGVLCISY